MQRGDGFTVKQLNNIPNTLQPGPQCRVGLELPSAYNAKTDHKNKVLVEDMTKSFMAEMGADRPGRQHNRVFIKQRQF